MPDLNEGNPSLSWWQRKWVQNGALLVAGVVAVYGMIYWDVVARARESYQEAEKYMSWHHHPELKRDYFEKKFAEEKARLDKNQSEKKITENDYKRQLDALEFDKKFNLEESSLKYAYQWYKDTYELFSPPESKWVRLARRKAPETLILWKQELTAQGVPFEDYMFE